MTVIQRCVIAFCIEMEQKKISHLFALSQKYSRVFKGLVL